MPNPIISRIWQRQKQNLPSTIQEKDCNEHSPSILLIGCIDARLSLESDVGIHRGEALIERKIAALVAGTNESGQSRLIEAATLEFAIKGRNVKDVVVMGHTLCGGIEACLHGSNLESVNRYLSPLSTARDAIKSQGGNLEAQARAMEQEAVRQSLTNLMSYKEVAEAVKGGKLNLHGWVIDIKTQRISVLDQDSGKFQKMSEL